MTFYSSLFPNAFIYEKKNTVYSSGYYYYSCFYIRFTIPREHRNILHISPRFCIFGLIDRNSKNIKTIKRTVNTLRFVYMSSNLLSNFEPEDTISSILYIRDQMISFCSMWFDNIILYSWLTGWTSVIN